MTASLPSRVPSRPDESRSAPACRRHRRIARAHDLEIGIAVVVHRRHRVLSFITSRRGPAPGACAFADYTEPALASSVIGLPASTDRRPLVAGAADPRAIDTRPVLTISMTPY